MQMKSSFLLAVLVIAFGMARAQDTTVTSQQIDTTAPNEMRQMQFKTTDTTVKHLLEQMQKVSDNDRQNAIAIQGLLQGKEVDNFTNNKFLKTNVINAPKTTYFLIKRII